MVTKSNIRSSKTHMSSSLIKSSLDDSQKAFCSEPSLSARLLAPAGSGKTHSLLWRCLNFQELSKDDQKFLIFTFTRAARDELRTRLNTNPSFTSLIPSTEITTLNSWGFRRLKSKMFGLRLCTSGQDRYTCINNVLQPVWQRHPRLKSTLENTRAKVRFYNVLMDLIDIFKTLGFRHDKYQGQEDLNSHTAWLINYGMNAHMSAIIKMLVDIEILHDNDDQITAIDEHFMRFWCEACDQLYKTSFITLEDQKYWALIDVEDMIIQGKYTTGMHRFHHILVDEFQDINVLDLNLLKAIAKINKSELTIVGDDDQAIYEWRGASPEFILKPDIHISPGYKTHILEINYRSPRNIVEHSQRLIKHNNNRVDKNVVAKSTIDAEIHVKKMPTLTDSINYVLDKVRELIDNQSIKNVAIIGRKRSQIIPYQIIFASAGIPFYAAEDLHILLSEAFGELKEMLAIKGIAELRGMFSSDPIGNLMKLCNKIKRFPLTSRDYRELKGHLYRDNPQNLTKAIESLCRYSGPLKGNNVGGEMSIKFATAIARLMEAKTVSETIEAISENFDGLHKDYGKSLDDIFYADPPFLYMSDYAERYGNDYKAFYSDIEKAIATLARIPSEDESEEVEESWKLPLHLMTALRAKGKEYDVVFILDANQDIWPSKFADTEEKLEQERRLFYVAFTRARKQVHILVNESILGEPVLPTPYLQEMGLLSFN